jgi:ribosome biogenesis protein ENP2
MHHYRLPVKSIQFHEAGEFLFTADAKAIKLTRKATGQPYTTIEPAADVNDIQLVGRSGLMFAACESPRVGMFFIPSIGPAPKWSSYLENITEELEEHKNKTIWSDFQFVTLDELER